MRAAGREKERKQASKKSNYPDGSPPLTFAGALSTPEPQAGFDRLLTASEYASQ